MVSLLATVVYLNLSRPAELGTAYSIDPALKAIAVEIEQLTEALDFDQLSEDEQYEQAVAILETLPPEYTHLKRRYQIAMAALPKITFWGRVVDQYGQPVVGAAIYNAGGNAWLSSGGGSGFAHTDDEGYFKVRNSGAGLTLSQIVHPEIEYGYLPDRGSYDRESQQFLISSKRFISQIDEGHPNDSWRKYTKKSKAYEINVWRLGEYEGAKGGGISTALSADGSVKTLRLHKPSGKRAPPGKTDGQFHISCYHPPIKHHLDEVDWRFTITPVNGGIQASDERYMNRAPETGYQAEWVTEMKAGSPDFKRQKFNQRFYFTANNGQDYGVLFIHVAPFNSIDRCGVNASYKINSTGSRNLELKKKPTDKYGTPQSKGPVETTLASS